MIIGYWENANIKQILGKLHMFVLRMITEREALVENSYRVMHGATQRIEPLDQKIANNFQTLQKEILDGLMT